jgi:hypothetical protein
MKSVKKDVQTVIRELKALTRKTERLMKAVDKLEKAQAAAKKKAKPKAKRKPAKKARVKKVAAKKTRARKKAPAKKKKVTATDKVLTIVKRSKKGVAVPTLMKKTGFDEKKVRNIISRAFKQKKIKRVGRGLYV